jgi:hypothetical protein
VRVEAIREREHSLSLSAAQLRSALQLLDKIAAQVDLALYQLEQELDLEKARGDLVQIERNAELQ